jgi:hypothetical protein
MFFSGFSGFGASPGGGFSFNPAADRGASLDALYAALELDSSATVADVRNILLVHLAGRHSSKKAS